MNNGYVDSHTHAYMLPVRDLELMSLAGINDVVLCSFVPVASHAETLIDHFAELDTVHRSRLADLGFNVYIFVGIHPRCIPSEWRKVMPVIEQYLEAGKAVGIGEIGLENASNLELEVLREQLRLVREYDVPAIIHVPMNNRVEIVDKILSLAAEIRLDAGRLVVDHTSHDTIDIVNEAGAIPGLSVKPGLLTPENVAENVDKYADGLLNSDCASLTNTDPLAVPKTVKYLKKAGIEKSIVERLAYRNAHRVLGKP